VSLCVTSLCHATAPQEYERRSKKWEEYKKQYEQYEKDYAVSFWGYL
jgi:hypothetical protein